MKINLYIIIFIFLYSCSFGQERRIPITYQSLVNQDSTNLYIYTSFSIPFNSLVFVKDGNIYKSNFTWTTELKSDKSEIIRDVKRFELSTDDYAVTVSADSFYKGFLSILCDTLKYNCSNLIEFGNTNFSYSFGETVLDLRTKLDSLLRVPIVTEELNNKHYLSNRGNIIPLSNSNYTIIFPNIDSNQDSLQIDIIQKNKTNKFHALKYEFENFVFATENKDVTVNFLQNTSNKSIYILNNFVESIEEGEFIISYIQNNKTYKNKLSLEWFDKPKSLSSNEIALDVLYSFFSKEKIDKISDLDDNEIYDGIKLFWNSNFPSKGRINGKMNEFFTRVDLAIEKFSISNKQNGYATDRGKIFIKYGEPDSIKREYTERDNIIELWNYKNINKTFIFNDISGIGNFTLVK